jgi:hypothetical protein
MKYRIYLDVCCFNRPYDDQSSETIRLETEAKLFIQDAIRTGQVEFLWSFMLSFENAANPFDDCRESISEWKILAIENISAGNSILVQAKSLEKLGIDPKDALHLSCALAGKADFFLTTDKNILKKSHQVEGIIIINPIEFIRLREDRHEK